MSLSIELVLAVTVGFVMAWAVGANDVANAMASTVGSKTLTVRSAVITAAIFEALGAGLASGQVTNMIRYGIVDISIYSQHLDYFVIGMLSALMSAATWLIIATHHGLPVSTTHSIIGAVIGFGVVSMGSEHILWYSVWSILASWVATPLCAIVLAYVVFSCISYVVFSSENPIKQANWLVPLCMMLLVLIFSGVTIFQGLDTIGIQLLDWQKQVMIWALASVTYAVGWQYTNKMLKRTERLTREKQLNAVEKKFGILSIMTAASMAYAHGSNDVANAIGPVAAIVQVLNTGTLAEEQPYLDG